MLRLRRSTLRLLLPSGESDAVSRRYQSSFTFVIERGVRVAGSTPIVGRGENGERWSLSSPEEVSPSGCRQYDKSSKLGGCICGVFVVMKRRGVCIARACESPMGWATHWACEAWATLGV